MTEFGIKHTDRAPYLLPQRIAASLRAGIDRIWLYELRDAPGNPYGLYNGDWTPKPAVDVIRRLNTVFADSGTGLPRPLGVTVSDPAINSVLIAKSDGSYVHLLWRSWPDGRFTVYLELQSTREQARGHVPAQRGELGMEQLFLGQGCRAVLRLEHLHRWRACA